ncbi:hypothetical protein [Rhizobium sp. MHM7A]|uniref:hypothetical protein n=1 Tax=Rhizobium sp. MHM7A TaxID=2583233 RepID=UPI001105E13B|nr:hypothetical protein [Rhizobium sp. MHM7A]TLX15851.1 hypothetical protein FFR93_00620 [Rhizobium sp. MHM7A]
MSDVDNRARREALQREVGVNVAKALQYTLLILDLNCSGKKAVNIEVVAYDAVHLEAVGKIFENSRKIDIAIQ